MARDILVHNGDVVITGGKTQLVDGEKEIIQRLENRLKTRKGELFTDTTYGIDYSYIVSIDSKEPTQELKELGVRECLLADEAVESVNIINVTKNDRETSIEFTARLTTGEIVTGGVEIA